MRIIWDVPQCWRLKNGCQNVLSMKIGIIRRSDLKRWETTALPNLWRIHRAIEPEYGQTRHQILVLLLHFNMYIYNNNKQVKQTKNIRTKKNY